MNRMFLYRCRPLLAAVLAGLLLLCAACGKQEPAPREPEDTPAVSQSAPAPEQETPPETPTEAAPELPAEEVDTGFSFAELAELEFCYSSGAGAWCTLLHIGEDGSFDGVYSDSDMGDMGEDYPYGTRYYSEFSGVFAQPEAVDETTLLLRVEELTYAHNFGEEIAEGFRWVYTDAQGIAGAEELLLYLPGAELAQLPEDFLTWVGYFDPEATEETRLPFHGLYNPAEACGFSSYALPSAAEQMASELYYAEIAAAELEADLQAGQTQLELSFAAEELYRLWDGVLNAAWQLLQEELDPEAMRQLTAEQLTWIAEKEAAVAAAGEAYAGGSMQPMAESLEAARLTEQRVYVLAEYLQ